MLSSHTTQSKDPSIFPLCGSEPTTACGRTASATSSEEAADFGALFADLNPTEPAEAVPAVDPNGLLVPALCLTFLPPPATLGPVPNLTPGGEVEATDGDEPVREAGEGTGAWFESVPRSDWTGPGTGTSAAPSVSGAHSPSYRRTTAISDLETAAESERAAPRTDVLPPTAFVSNPVSLPTRAMPVEPTQIRGLHSVVTPDPSEVGATLPAVETVLSGTDRSNRKTTSDGPAAPTAGEMGAAVRAEAEVVGQVPAAAPGASDRTLRWEEFASNLRPGRNLKGEEKIAAAGEPGPEIDAEEFKPRKKSFLSAGEEAFASRPRPLGIDVAKPVGNMSTPHFNAPTTHPKSDYTMTAVTAATSEIPGAARVEEAGDTFSTAHEAVEVVLHAVEHVASRAQKSVQLNFSVAGEELAVRVELRADEVRTTFRTDSAELRAALAQEWQQVSAPAQSDRPVRIAPAVFAAAEHAALNAFAGDTSSRGRRQGASRGEAEAALVGIRGRAVATTSHPVALPSVATPVRTRGSHRLHTLA